MILLVTGSRLINKRVFVYDCLEEVCAYPNNVYLIIHGNADGVDTLAKEFAHDRCIPEKGFEPKYEVYGKYAPLKRNDLMVGMCDKGVAIWDGKSKGTKYTIEKLREQGKLLKVFRSDQNV